MRRKFGFVISSATLSASGNRREVPEPTTKISRARSRSVPTGLTEIDLPPAEIRRFAALFEGFCVIARMGKPILRESLGIIWLGLANRSSRRTSACSCGYWWQFLIARLSFARKSRCFVSRMQLKTASSHKLPLKTTPTNKVS